jgi:hypothetical protein
MNDDRAQTQSADPECRLTTHGVQDIGCTVLQMPADENHHYAVVVVSVITTAGATFRAIGEAVRESLPGGYENQTLTVAEIRATERALDAAAGRLRRLGSPHTGGLEQAVTPAEAGPETAEESSDTEPSSPAPDSDSDATVDEPAAAVETVHLTEVTVDAAPPVGETAAVAVVEAPAESVDKPAPEAPPEEPGPSQNDGVPQRQVPPRPAVARTTALPQLTDELGPDVLARLLQLTRKKAESEGTAIIEEEAMRRLDSYFQRAFGHPVAVGTRVEGQRVVQRLMADLTRLGAASGRSGTRGSR